MQVYPEDGHDVCVDHGQHKQQAAAGGGGDGGDEGKVIE